MSVRAMFVLTQGVVCLVAQNEKSRSMFRAAFCDSTDLDVLVSRQPESKRQCKLSSD
jgi:hypothetical protein